MTMSYLMHRHTCDAETTSGLRCKNTGMHWVCDVNPETKVKTPRLLCAKHYDMGATSGVDHFHESAPDRREQASKHGGYSILYGDPLKEQSA